MDLIREFLNETHDNLTALDDDMLALEREPHDTATLARVFGVLHTIKGSCGFLKLQRLEKIARWGEHLLAYFRDNHLPITKNAVILVLRIVDTVRDVLMGLERDRVEPVGDDAALERAVDTLMASRDKNTLPDDGMSRAPSKFKSVLFPEPEGPSTSVVLPCISGIRASSSVALMSSALGLRASGTTW